MLKYRIRNLLFRHLLHFLVFWLLVLENIQPRIFLKSYRFDKVRAEDKNNEIEVIEVFFLKRKKTFRLQFLLLIKSSLKKVSLDRLVWPCCCSAFCPYFFALFCSVITWHILHVLLPFYGKMA